MGMRNRMLDINIKDIKSISESELENHISNYFIKRDGLDYCLKCAEEHNIGIL